MTTPYTCKLSPTEYKEAFEKARKNEAIIKNKLEKKHPSLTIIIPERQEDVNSREEADDYIDEGDLYIDFNKGKKPKLTEIKCLSYQWTCREDFPFQRSLIVNSVEGINKKIKQGFGIPDYTLIVADDMNNFIRVHKRSFHKWYKWPAYDKRKAEVMLLWWFDFADAEPGEIIFGKFE